VSTKAQQRTNQSNAEQSTGPQTEQGKQTCSQNALKHGLRAKHPVIPGEDPAEYQHKVDQLRADLWPVNALEDSLVEQIADTSWRLKRLARIEAAIERDHIEDAAGNEKNAGKDDEQILGYALTSYGQLDYMNRLARYETQLSRRYHRAIKELSDLRKNRQQLLFRVRPMDERDREEQHWRARHSHPPPQPLRPQRATANGTTNRAPTRVNDAADSKITKQTQSGATSLDSMSMDQIGELAPAEVLDLVEREMQGMSSTSGPQSPAEADK
jgi:hypothetical protein